MVTFNVDSLDFVDDEESRFGVDPDFATRFSSGSDRFEIADLTNAAVSYVPRNRGGDIVNGRFAETVDEEKVLSDDGNVYDNIQTAVNNGTSWAKIGPGTFNERVSVNKQGFTLVGSGDRTVINFPANSGNEAVYIDATDVTVSSMQVQNSDSPSNSCVRVAVGAFGAIIDGITIRNSNTNRGIRTREGDCTIVNCDIDANVGVGIQTVSESSNYVISNNVVRNTQDVGIELNPSYESVVSNNVVYSIGRDGIYFDSAHDNIVMSNVVYDIPRIGIRVSGTDSIVANNNVRADDSPIFDNGTNTTLDANITTNTGV